jgi:hypothetical protein
MQQIDFTANSPDQLYEILKDFPNQDDSEEISYEKEVLFQQVCEALRPLTVNSSNKTKLELLQLALDYHLKLRRESGLIFDFQKFAVYVLKYEHFKETERFFDEKITELSNKILKKDLLDVGVTCLKQHLGLGNLSKIRINGEFDQLEELCDKVIEIDGIDEFGITDQLTKFSEKLSEEL